MYENFQAADRWTGKSVSGVYQALILAISTRHADAVDIKFLVDGQPVWVSLPQVAWGEYHQRTGKMMTDPMAVQIAGHFLKRAIESGDAGGREFHALTLAEAMRHVDELVEEERAALKK